MPKKLTRVRRARGTGTIFRDESRGVWVGRVPVGRNADGSTRYVERSDPDQRKLVEKLKQAGPPGPETTVGQWCDRWLAGLTVRPGTRMNYENNVAQHIKPKLGHLRVRDLTPYHIEQAAREWAKPQGTLTTNTVRLVLGHLSACLNAAIRAELLGTNPVRVARRPRGKRKEIDPFSAAELNQIIAEATKQRTTRPIAVLAATGCRVGEALALAVTDWDAAAETIAITKTVGQIRAHGLGPPKTANSVRTIRVPTSAHQAIRDAIGRRRSGPMFATATGQTIDKRALSRVWADLLKRLGLSRRNPHQLRHSVATVLISAGDPPGTVAEYLGDTPETIVKTYLHSTGSDPSRTLDRLLGGCKVEERPSE